LAIYGYRIFNNGRIESNILIFFEMYCRFIQIFFVFVLAGCTQSSHPESDKPPGMIRVTDFRGKEIILQQPASRIVCLMESALSGLYMLNAYSQLAGISTGVYNDSASQQYARLDERIHNKTLPAAGNWDFVNIESIVALKPDLVIIWASQNESVSAIEEYGIPVYGVDLQSFDDVFKEISDFGILTGRKGRADSLINYTKNEMEALSFASNGSSDKKTVYFIWAQGILETSGTKSTVNELIGLAGAKNVCLMPQEHVVISKEKLLDYNPDIILMWHNNRQKPENLFELPEFCRLKAVKNKKIFELPPVFWCDLWTLKYQLAVKILAKECYPEKFQNMNLESEKCRMLQYLYGDRSYCLINE
jgi:iron complex transport system substrate-binding protein